jgi:hypothetical protein
MGAAFSSPFLAQMNNGDLLESFLAHKALHGLNYNERTAGVLGSLEYLSVPTICLYFKEQVCADNERLAVGFYGGEKRIMTLKPKPVFRTAAEAKEEMIELYAKDGYYFLEEYIDTLMVKSHSKILNY